MCTIHDLVVLKRASDVFPPYVFPTSPLRNFRIAGTPVCVGAISNEVARQRLWKFIQHIPPMHAGSLGSVTQRRKGRVFYPGRAPRETLFSHNVRFLNVEERWIQPYTFNSHSIRSIPTYISMYCAVSKKLPRNRYRQYAGQVVPEILISYA